MQQATNERKRTLQETLERTKTSLENLTSLRIRDLIGDDEFLRERRKLETDQLRLRQQLEESGQTDSTFEPLEALISFRNRAIEWFRDGDDGTKRLIFGIVGSNPVLRDKIVSIEAKKPFRVALETVSLPQLRAVREDIRTSLSNNDPELLSVLHGIRELEMKFGVRRSDGSLSSLPPAPRRNRNRSEAYVKEHCRASGDETPSPAPPSGLHLP